MYNKQEYMKKWRSENKEKRKEYKKRYRLKYPEKRKEGRKAYLLKHPDKVKEYKERYRLKHPEKMREYRRKYYYKHKIQIMEKRKLNNRYKKHPWLLHLKWAKRRCKDSKNKSYCGKGIKCLLSKLEIKDLWFRDKAFNLKRPSIDRLNNKNNYTYSNCQFIELLENNKKH